MAKLDLKDRKLLVALSQNARVSQAQLGKAVGISKSAVPYRIKRLQKEGVIRRFFAVMNFSAVGLNTYNVFFKLNTSKEREDGVFAYFDQHPNVVWTCRFLGMWDFHVEVVANDFEHFNFILSEILVELGDCLDDYRTHLALEVYKVEHLPKQFVEEASVEALKLPDRTWKEKITLDAVEKKILFALNEDGVAPLHEIAKACGTTLDVVYYRMKKLYKEGVILQYIPFVDLGKLGFTQYFCHLELRHLTADKEKTLKQFLVQHKNVKYAFRGATQLEVLFLLAVQNVQELDDIVRELKQRFGKHILDLHTHLIIEQGNFTMWPKGLVD
jgi:Lrp/AsnC family transcriptional regulator, leucine-responsive regulatory protein